MIYNLVISFFCNLCFFDLPVLIQIGNFIEPVLVEIRDIKYIFAAAKSKRWVKIQQSA